MDKSIKFQEFVSKNPPPFLPGDPLYWFCNESGEINKQEGGIGPIVLTEDWEWKFIDLDNGEIVSPNQDAYLCITKEAAKMFRDNVGTVEYAVFMPDPEGLIIVDEKNYSFVFKKSFDVLNMTIDQSYIDYVLESDDEVKPGMVVWFGKHVCVITEDGVIDDEIISADCKKGKRILEDIFDE